MSGKNIVMRSVTNDFNHVAQTVVDFPKMSLAVAKAGERRADKQPGSNNKPRRQGGGGNQEECS